MSVENLADPDNALLAMSDHTPCACFYCGKRIAGALVVVEGAGGDLYFHAKCAIRAGTELLELRNHGREEE